MPQGVLFLIFAPMQKVIAHIPITEKDLKSNLEIYKREGRRFWLRNEYIDFHIDLYDYALYTMVERYNMGDIINLPLEEDEGN